MFLLGGHIVASEAPTATTIAGAMTNTTLNIVARAMNAPNMTFAQVNALTVDNVFSAWYQRPRHRALYLSTFIE